MRRWRGVIPALAVCVLLGACSGGDDGGTLSTEALADAGDTCPFDLDAAAAQAGLGDEGTDVEVEVDSSLDGADAGAGALGQARAVFVDCTRPLAGSEGDNGDDGDGGGDDDQPEISGYVLASEQPGAISLLLPLIQHDLELGVDDLSGIFDRYNAADEGDLFDLGADGPWAAARIAVDDADSAVLYVAATGDTSEDQVRDVTERLVDEL